MRSMNPATGEVLKDYPEHSDAEVDAALARAVETFESWRELPFAERSRLMHRAAIELRDRRDEHAALMTAEMGKTLASARAEAEKCALCCDFYAEHAEAFLAPEVVATDASRSLVRYDPIGPVLAVMPWNFPYWQVFRFAAPALMAGNVGLLKHASNVPGCALAIEEVFRRAGFPEGCFQTLLIGSRAVEAVIRNGAVRAVTLTGSEPAGVAVASAAGSCLKKTVLELGGSDPFVVLGDGDVLKAAKAAALARCINNGQSCIAAKRFIVVEEVADAFEEAFVAAMAALKVGDPMDPATDVGPMAREDLLAELHDQVERSVRAGADPTSRRGAYWTARAPSTRPPCSRAFAPACPPSTRRPSAPWRRSSAPWTRTTPWPWPTVRPSVSARASGPVTSRAARRWPAGSSPGSVFVNGPVKSDPRLPFGGVKRSGYGRELSAFGIREFVNIKTVWIA